MSYQAKIVLSKPVRSDSLPKDSSVEVLTPVTTSSLTNQFNNLMSKKREDQDYSCQKIQEIVLNKKRDLFNREEACGLAKKLSRLSFDHDDEKKKRKIVREPVLRNYITEELIRFIADEMVGTDTKLVIQKVLNYNDIKEDYNRLHMPIEQLETQDFLTVEEKKDLEEDKRKIVVPLVGPRLQMYEQPMVLGRCHMASTKNYVLKTKWNYFVKDNEDDLKEDSKIQVWSFRRDQQLCFALVVVERANAVNELIEDLLMSSINR